MESFNDVGDTPTENSISEIGQGVNGNDIPENEENAGCPSSSTRRSTRVRKPNTWYNGEKYTNHMALLSLDDATLQNYKQAVKSAESDFWYTAMKKKMKSLNANDTFDLVFPPVDAIVIGNT